MYPPLYDTDMRDYTLYGNSEAEICILRLTGEHEKEQIEYELAEIRKSCHSNNWCIAYIPIDCWENELAPWAEADANSENNKSGANDTLRRIIDEIVSNISSRCQSDSQKYYLAGYSLAGLFSLWASYQTDIFEGIAAVSPSVWYPGWMEYIAGHKCLTNNIYLSIGSKEHKTRNQMMAHVRSNITKMYDSFLARGYNSILEINEGNHFKDPHIRMAKGIKWLIESNTSTK